VIEDAVDGPLPQPDPNGADVEVALDWQVLSRALLAAAPKATIRLVLRYAPNTDQGFSDLWNSFVSDPTYSFTGVSTSWGWPRTSGPREGRPRWTPRPRPAWPWASSRSRPAATTAPATAAATEALCGLSGLEPQRPRRRRHQAGGERREDQQRGGVERGRPRRRRRRRWRLHVLPRPLLQSANGISEKSLGTGQTGRSEPDMAADADPVTGLRGGHRHRLLGPANDHHRRRYQRGGAAAHRGLHRHLGILGARLGRIQDPPTPWPIPATASTTSPTEQRLPDRHRGYSAGPGFDVPSGWGSPIFSELAAGFSTAVPTQASGGAGTTLTGRRGEQSRHRAPRGTVRHAADSGVPGAGVR